MVRVIGENQPNLWECKSTEEMICNMESYNKERRKEIEEGNIQENLVIGSMDV